MPRLGLRSAGRAVEDRAKALAGDLLLVEQGAGAAITDHFTRFAPAASEFLRRGVFPFHLDDALAASTATARASLGVGTALAVDCVQDELAVLADAMSAQTAARAGMEHAARQHEEALADGMLAFNASIPGVRARFANYLRLQTMRYRDHEDLQRRVFAERAVAGMGVGAWYRPPIWLLGQVRASMYAAVNHILIHGIDGMNRGLEAG